VSDRGTWRRATNTQHAATVPPELSLGALATDRRAAGLWARHGRSLTRGGRCDGDGTPSGDARTFRAGASFELQDGRGRRGAVSLAILAGSADGSQAARSITSACWA